MNFIELCTLGIPDTDNGKYDMAMNRKLISPEGIKYLLPLIGAIALGVAILLCIVIIICLVRLTFL